MEIRVLFSLKGAFREDAIAGGVVSQCPALNIYSHGATKEDAKSALISTVQLFVETCYQRGTLGKVLKEAGFIPMPHRVGVALAAAKQDECIEVHQTKQFADEFVFEVPLNLIAQSQTVADFQHV
jgi:hypothetical protein